MVKLSDFDIAEQDFDANFDEHIVVIDVLEKLHVHVEDLLMRDMVPAHFVEHLLGLKQVVY